MEKKIMEYWSDGVMEIRGIKEIRGIGEIRDYDCIYQYSITPKN